MTFADYLLEFKSLRIPNEKFAELVPTIKQRVYSICSSSDYRPGKCQLLVVREDWQAKGGSTKFGLCSSFLTFVRPGQYLVGHHGPRRGVFGHHERELVLHRGPGRVQS